MVILKEEINALNGEITSLAKWKLIVFGTFAIAGLGWGEIKPDGKTGLLLLYCVGFLCAYTDSLYYRRATVIHVIAGYLRAYEGKDPETLELREFERCVSKIRERRLFFVSDRWPQFVASLVVALGLPVLGMIRYNATLDWKCSIPLVASVIIVALFVAHGCNRKSLIDSSGRVSWAERSGSDRPDITPQPTGPAAALVELSGKGERGTLGKGNIQDS